MRNYLKTFANRTAARQVLVMGGIGVVNTIIDFGLFNLFRALGWGLYVALTVAFVLATAVSFVLNRRITFGMAASGARPEEGIGFLVLNVVALAATAGIVWAAESLFGPLTPLGENLAKIVAALVILLPKFAALRDVVFRRALRSAEGAEADPG